MKITSFIAGVAVGAIAGGAAVALTTPKRGAELRSDIKKEYDHAVDKIDQYKDSATDKIGEYKEKVGAYTEELKETSKEEISKIFPKKSSNSVEENEE